MLTRTIYLSMDPYQWGRRRSGVEAPGEVCHGRTVAQVVHSRLAGFNEGDYVFNTNGWQTLRSDRGSDLHLWLHVAAKNRPRCWLQYLPPSEFWACWVLPPMRG